VVPHWAAAVPRAVAPRLAVEAASGAAPRLFEAAVAAVVVAAAEAARALRPAALVAAGVSGLAGFVALWAAAGAAVLARAAVPGPGPAAVRVALGGRQPSEEAEPAAWAALQPARPVQAPR
jgi:hypothetical protein